MARIRVNDIHLDVERNGAGPAVLLLHGFTGSHATWAPFLDAWPGFSLITVDLLGHGHSDYSTDPDRYRMEYCVADLVAVLNTLEIERVAVLGYSMGGRVALHLALYAPGRLWGLIVESASPGIAETAARVTRIQSDAVLAEFIEREGVVAFVDRWQSLSLFATQARLPAATRDALRRQRLDNNPTGLANSLRGLGTGMQKSVLERLGAVECPALLLAGALDNTYCEFAHRMARALPYGWIEIAPDAGHTVHLEQPEFFTRTVRGFLATCMQIQQRKEDL